MNGNGKYGKILEDPFWFRLQGNYDSGDYFPASNNLKLTELNDIQLNVFNISSQRPGLITDVQDMTETYPHGFVFQMCIYKTLICRVLQLYLCYDLFNIIYFRIIDISL